MGGALSWVVEPGFFSNGPVHVALAVGVAVAIVSAPIGVFTVARGHSFGGHALTDVSMAGGSGALLVGLGPLPGFLGACVLGAGAMEAVGGRRGRGRDLGTGIVLGAATGLAALFLYLDSTAQAASGATQQILFGSIFVLGSSTVPAVVLLGALVLALTALCYRPLLLHSVDPDLARARGAPVRLVGAGYVLALALAVGLASLAIGAVLSTALLVGPAATALRLTRRMGRAVALAALVGAGTTAGGVLLAYDSYYWGRSHNGWPVSFFVVALVLAGYLLAGLAGRGRRREVPCSAG